MKLNCCYDKIKQDLNSYKGCTYFVTVTYSGYRVLILYCESLDNT